MSINCDVGIRINRLADTSRPATLTNHIGLCHRKSILDQGISRYQCTKFGGSWFNHGASRALRHLHSCSQNKICTHTPICGRYISWVQCQKHSCCLSIYFYKLVTTCLQLVKKSISIQGYSKLHCSGTATYRKHTCHINGYGKSSVSQLMHYQF